MSPYDDFLDIFADTIRLATWQPRWRERPSPAPRRGEGRYERPAALQPPERRGRR